MKFLRRFHWPLALGGLALTLSVTGSAQSGDSVEQSVESRRTHYAEMAMQIWNLAEVGYQEVRSSEILQTELKAEGFGVESGVAGMPTAFVASYGEGSPVIGILAEFDALPGISQEVAAERAPIPGLAAGHACGHHLFGTGSVAAAIAAKEWLERSGTSGTIRLYGTPAEEGGAGKVYMVRAGLFDGVEAMNHMVNLMREHVPEESRIHYVITSGGSAPNVVPDFAEVYYYCRNPGRGGRQERLRAYREGRRGRSHGNGARALNTNASTVSTACCRIITSESCSTVLFGKLAASVTRRRKNHLPNRSSRRWPGRVLLAPRASPGVCSDCDKRINRRGGCQLGCSHGAIPDGDLGPRDPGAQLAGSILREV